MAINQSINQHRHKHGVEYCMERIQVIAKMNWSLRPDQFISSLLLVSGQINKYMY